MIGIPKITGSLMLKIPGARDNLVICFISSRFPTSNTAISRPIVTPDPPILIYISQNGIVIMFGTSFPASKASVFTAIAAKSNGSRIGFTI